MRVPLSIFAMLLLGACASAPEDAGNPDEGSKMTLRGAVAIAFFAASPDSDDEMGQRFQEALGPIVACLAGSGVELKASQTHREWIKVKDRERQYPLYSPFEGKPAVFLLQPGRLPRYVGRTDAEDLDRSLAGAAAAYFDLPGCARGAAR